MLNVFDVSKYFISQSAPGTEQNITNLKLQKLLYYAQGFHYAFYDEYLFEDEIQAWLHGPVVPSVYRKYSRFNFREIPLSEGEISSSEFNDSKNHCSIELIEKIWFLFKNFSGKELEKKTHREDPWKHRWEVLPNGDYANHEIEVEIIAEYFKNNYLKQKSD